MESIVQLQCNSLFVSKTDVYNTHEKQLNGREQRQMSSISFQSTERTVSSFLTSFWRANNEISSRFFATKPQRPLLYIVNHITILDILWGWIYDINNECDIQSYGHSAGYEIPTRWNIAVSYPHVRIVIIYIYIYCIFRFLWNDKAYTITIYCWLYCYTHPHCLLLLYSAPISSNISAPSQ